MSVDVYRPTVQADGDLLLGAVVSGVRASIWDMRAREVVGAVGELVTVTARGYFVKTADLEERDRIVAPDGRRWEVVKTISGISDRGILDHVGAYLRNVD
jgi:hypothetical protein